MDNAHEAVSAEEIIKTLNQICNQNHVIMKEVEALTVATNFCTKHDELLKQDIETNSI